MLLNGKITWFFGGRGAFEQTLDQMMTPESVASVMKLFNEEIALITSGNIDPNRFVFIETGEPGNGARFEIIVPNGKWRIGNENS